jgi:hypothetical protein
LPAHPRVGQTGHYEQLFRPEDEPAYRRYIDDYVQRQHAAGKRSPKEPTTDAARLTQFRTWRTYQLSDHLPLWAEFRVDFADEYLAGIGAA